MRRISIHRLSHRWLTAFSVLALFTMAEGSFAFSPFGADDACIHRCLDEPGCRGLAVSCSTAATTCCEWGARVLLSAPAKKFAPSYRQKDQPTPFALESRRLSLILAQSYRAGSTSDKAYSAGAGTATYLATARLRI